VSKEANKASDVECPEMAVDVFPNSRPQNSDQDHTELNLANTSNNIAPQIVKDCFMMLRNKRFAKMNY